MTRRPDPRELILGAFVGATGALLGLVVVVLWRAFTNS